jgi:regulator of RNase E activity RraA
MSSSSDHRFPFRPTCDLYDEYVDLARVPTLPWKSYGRQKQFCGDFVTVKCFEDNSRVKELVKTSGDHKKVLDIRCESSMCVAGRHAR